jgi:2-methylcitrate dehydratase
MTKFFPTAAPTHSSISAAILAREKIKRISDISRIEVKTTEKSFETCGSDPEKWNPKTRETADHSIPYVVAVALIDGRVSDASFGDEKLRDKEVIRLMKVTSVTPDKSLESDVAGRNPSRVTVKLKSGEAITGQVEFPRGHPRNPASEEEVVQKFRQNASQQLSPIRIGRLTELVQGLDEIGDVSELVAACVSRP